MSITSLCKNVGVSRPISSSEWPDFGQSSRFLTLLDETAQASAAAEKGVQL